MRAKKLIERLENLATFLTLKASDAKKRSNESKTISSMESRAFWEGREDAYRVAFNKVDAIIKEAKE